MADAPSRLTFHLIPHTHWDREWYLPEAGFRPRLLSMAGAVLDLLERDPDARFVFDGQTILIEDVLAARPAWRQRIRRAVREHQLDLGPWYVLADELVPTGESLLRNLLEGASAAAELGARMNVLYSPDAFGHPAILPMLAREFGIDAAVLWRGLGSPKSSGTDLHRWQAPDGNTALTYHLPPQGYEIGADLVGAPDQIQRRWQAIRAGLVERALTSQVAVFVGADHHAPPHSFAPCLGALRALEPDHEVRISSLSEFFAAAAPLATQAGLIQGELRWSYGYTWTLQGTHATRARLKRRHGAVERYLQRVAEPLAALAAWRGTIERQDLIRGAARTLLACQFHDTLCGCCSDDVAREHATRLTSVTATARELVRSALHELTGHDADLARAEPLRATPTLLLWNPLPRIGGGIVTAEVTWFVRDVLVGPPSDRAPRTGEGFPPFVLVAGDGRRIPVQLLSRSRTMERIDASRHYPDQDEVDRALIAFDAPDLPGLGIVALTLAPDPATAPASGLEVHDRSLTNRFLDIRVDDDGRIDLTDRRSGESYRDLMHLVDEHDRGDSYTPSISSRTGRSTLRCTATSVLAAGPLVGALQLRFAMPLAEDGDISGRLVLILYADSPILRVRLEVENQAIDHRLRLCLPVGLSGPSIAGSAFGFEYRESRAPSTEDLPDEQPSGTAPAHRYVMAANEERSVTILAPRFFEYESTNDGDLLVTVLRGTGELSRDTLPERPGHAGWPTRTPLAQERGTHLFEAAIAVTSAPNTPTPADLERLWEETFVPVHSTFIRDFSGTDAAAGAPAIELHGRGLVFSALKPAHRGAGIVLRCFNTASTAVTGQWRFGEPVASATLARADETALHPIELADRRVIEFTAPARGLATVVVTAR